MTKNGVSRQRPNLGCKQPACTWPPKTCKLKKVYNQKLKSVCESCNNSQDRWSLSVCTSLSSLLSMPKNTTPFLYQLVLATIHCCLCRKTQPPLLYLHTSKMHKSRACSVIIRSSAYTTNTSQIQLLIRLKSFNRKEESSDGNKVELQILGDLLVEYLYETSHEGWQCLSC